MEFDTSVQVTILSVLGYLQIILWILLIREIAFHLIPALKGDETVMLRARQKIARRKADDERRKLVDTRYGELEEKREDEIEIKDERDLILILENMIQDLHSHGTTEVDRLLSHLSQARARLNDLEKLETREISSFKKHLTESPHHKELWLSIEKKGKLTLLIEQLLARAEQNLTTNPNLAEHDLRMIIKILSELVQEEKKEEQLAA
jgi:hypothetical protein